jgi:hypothetical protein
MRIKHIAIRICKTCLDGVGEVCRTPGCALYLHSVDLPIDENLYIILDEYELEEERQDECKTDSRKADNDINNLIIALQKEIYDYNIALYDAILSPKGVVPDSALKFYSIKEIKKAEERLENGS